MEAIAEMIGAIFVAIFELVFLGIQLVLTGLALIVEVAITAMFQGRAAAAEKYRQRRAASETTQKSDSNQPGDSAAPTTQVSVKRQWAIGILIVLFSVGYGGIAWYQRELTKQRVAQTWKQIDLLADRFSAQVKLPQPQLPEGKLPDLDAWRTPCELFVDEWLLGTLIVARSWGPDSRHGTLDDLLAIRFTRPPLKVFGKKLLAVGIDLIRDQVQKMLPGKGVPPQNMNIRIDE